MQKFICLAACLLAALSLASPLSASSIDDAGVISLRIVNSARAVALGGAVANLVDEESPHYSPGAVGIFHLHKYFAVTSPNSTKWLPELASDLELTKFSVSAGYALSFGDKSNYHRPRIALAAAYSRFKFDYGTIPIDDSQSTSPYDKADGYTFAAGFEYYLRAGIGFTHKTIKSDLSVPFYSSVAKGDASDYGVLVEFPIVNLLSRRDPAVTPEDGSLQFEFTPSVAYVKANDGDGFKYSGVFVNESLPTTSKTGIALKTGVKRDQLPLATLLLVYESEKELYNDDRKSNRRGVELGLYDVLYARLGKLDDDWGELHPYSFGFGVSFGGLLTWLESRNVLQRGEVLRRVDLNFDYAQYEGGDYPLADTKFYRLRLSI